MLPWVKNLILSTAVFISRLACFFMKNFSFAGHVFTQVFFQGFKPFIFQFFVSIEKTYTNLQFLCCVHGKLVGLCLRLFLLFGYLMFHEFQGEIFWCEEEAPKPKVDNTYWYIGFGILALVVVGGILYMVYSPTGGSPKDLDLDIDPKKLSSSAPGSPEAFDPKNLSSSAKDLLGIEDKSTGTGSVAAPALDLDAACAAAAAALDLGEVETVLDFYEGPASQTLNLPGNIDRQAVIHFMDEGFSDFNPDWSGSLGHLIAGRGPFLKNSGVGHRILDNILQIISACERPDPNTLDIINGSAGQLLSLYMERQLVDPAGMEILENALRIMGIF